VGIADFHLGGLLLFTDIHDEVTARGEAAAGWEVEEGGGLAFYGEEALVFTVQVGDGVD
jgi:hypothetical protein